MFKIYTKRPQDLSPKEVDECLLATLHGEGRYGLMTPQLSSCRRNPDSQSRATLCYYNGDLVGWALGFYNPNQDVHEVYIYVHERYRRMGVGTKLLARTRMGRKGKIGVNCHTPSATKFFNHAIKQGRAKDVWGY